jgi:MFS family permease
VDSFTLSNRKSIYYIAWFSISLFYFYQYILRVSPGIMIVELRQIYKLTAEEFSSLGAIYLYAYSLLQVPLGFVLDRLGVRRVMAVSILMCIGGTCLFAFATTVGMLQIARFCIGMGSAPAFICALKLVSDHLSAKDQGLFMGATLAIGTVGALLSGKFFVSLLETIGREDSLLLCAGVGVLILLIVLGCVPSFQKKETRLSQGAYMQLREGLGAIAQRKEILLYAFIAISVYTPLCVLADLWGTAFLMEKFELNRADAAQITLYMYGGLTVGSLLLPWFSLKWGRLRETIQVCSVGIIGALLMLLYIDTLTSGQLTVLLTLIGIFCGAEMICFAGAAQLSSVSHSGLSLGVVNTLNMLGGAVIQQAIGWYLDFQWQGVYGKDGARAYGPDELTAAFLILIVIMAACTLMTFKLPKRNL